MSIDSREFRQTVGHFVTGVTVIATEAEGAPRAMTANAFTSLSLDPPLVLVCIAKTAHMAKTMLEATGFSVSILEESRQDLSTYFAGGWKHPDPPLYSFVPWEGGPLLEGCTAAIGCAIEAIHEGGDHWIVVGRVLALYRGDPSAMPLVFNRGRYTALAAPVDAPSR